MTPPVAAGCDVVDVARFARVLARRPGMLIRVFTARERADARRGGAEAGSLTHDRRLAARFAAKEATRKALRDRRLGFTAVEVRTTSDGAPHLWVHGEPSPLACSLSHDGGVAMALVVGATVGTAAPVHLAASDLPTIPHLPPTPADSPPISEPVTRGA